MKSKKATDADVTPHGKALDPVLYDWEGAARLLGVTSRLIRELWARRELGGTKIGRRVRFSDDDLAEYVSRHHVDAMR